MTDDRTQALHHLAAFLRSELADLHPTPDVDVVETGATGLDVVLEFGDELQLRCGGTQVLDMLQAHAEDQHRAILDNWVAELRNAIDVTGPDAFSEDDTVILAVVAGRNDGSLNLARRSTTSPLVDAVIAYNSDDALMLPTVDPARSSNLQDDETWVRAQEHLESMSAPTVVVGTGPTRVVGIVAGDGLDASRALLLPQTTADLFREHEIPQPWLLCVPHRGRAILTSSRDPLHMMRLLFQTMLDYKDAPNRERLFHQPLYVEPDGVCREPFDVGGDGPLSFV